MRAVRDGRRDRSHALDQLGSRMRRYTTLILTLAVLAAGTVAAAVDAHAIARWIWLAGTIGLGAPLVFRTIRGALRGVFASDLVASLSIVGAVALDQPLAG